MEPEPAPRDSDRDNRRLKAVLLFTATLAFAVAPTFLPGFRGFDPEAFPVPQPAPLIQPAGYAFLIWLPIYVWLLAHGAWGLFARADDLAWDRPRWPLFASVALGASWLAAATISPLFATVQIWLMLALAIVALRRVPAARERMMLAHPVALYAGWLTAAAAVALGTVIVGYGIVGEVTAALIGLGLATGIGLAVQLRVAPSPLFAAALIWALIGIAVADFSRAPLLALVAALAAGAVAVVALRGRQQT